MGKQWRRMVACVVAAVMLISTVVFAEEALPEDGGPAAEETELLQDDIEDFPSQAEEEPKTEAETLSAAVLNDAESEQTDIVKDFADTENITGISDETFYGEYDAEKGEWIQEGYFDYDAHPEMEDVKEAVMEANGDYSEVKQAVLEYYFNKRNGYTLPLYGSTGVQQVFLAQALERDLYPHISWKVLGFQEVTAEPQYVDFDVSYTWSDIVKSAGKEVSFYVMATRKDGTMAEIESHEAEHPPLLEVESNGVVTTFSASEDATMIAGSNANKKYGEEDTLRIEESVSSIGKADPTDSETKRALIKFDLSSLNMDDTVTRATLKLYGRNATNDNAKELIVMKVTTNTWSEKSVTFANYEHMAYSWDGEGCIRFITPKYSGHRYREELQRFESVYPLIGGMFVQGETNREYYAYIALKIWCGFLQQSGRTPIKPPGDTHSGHPLDIGCRGIAVPEAMAWFITSEHMTADIYSATLKHFWLAIDEMVRTGYGMNGSNNVAAVGVRGLHTMNTYYNEFRIHKKAQEQVWAKQKRIYDIDLIRSDGAYSEGSLAYASMGGGNIITLLEPNEVTGCEDLPFEDPALFNKVEEVALYLAKMSAPGFHDNQWGDGSEATTGYLNTLKNWNKRFQNPYLNYYTGDENNGEPFPFTSCKYDSERRIALRSGWGENDVYLYTDMDGGTVSHAHKDDNAIILSAYGKYLLADPLYASYSDETAKFGSTAFHNTVEIDGQNQKGGGKGDIQYWETNSIYDSTSNWSKSYRSNGTNEWHERNILYIRPGFFLVSDYLKPYDTDTATHTYRQRWIMPPDADMTIDTDSMTARSNTASTANIQVVQADKDNIALTKVNDRYIGTYTDRAVYTKSGSGAVLFDTVLYPEQAGERVSVSSERIALENVSNNGVSAVQVKITDQGRESDITYYLVHDLKQKTVRRFGDYETDARLAYVERNGSGDIVRLIIQNGTYIKDKKSGKDLFRSQKNVSQFGCYLQHSLLELASTSETELDKLTFLADSSSAVSKVEYNGEKQNFSKSGRYIYFGSDPILEDTDLPAPSPSPKPSNGSGNGGSGGGVNRPGSSGIGGGTGGAHIPPAEPQPTQKPDSSQEQLLAQIKGHWAEKEIGSLIQDGVIKGSGGNLNLKQDVTRAEFAAMLLRGLGIAEEMYRGDMSDVAAQDWYAGVMQACMSHHIMSGDDGKMRPNDLITREEMAKMAIAAYGTDYDSEKNVSFTDGDKISGWAVEYVAQAVDAGLINGFEDGSFRPQAATLREQAMVVVARLRNLIQEK